MQKMEKNHTVEFIRFIFAIIIVYFHILHSNIIPYVSDSTDIYINLSKQCSWASAIVECFLIIGGFYLYLSEKRNMNKPVLLRITDKWARLWPVLAFYVIINVLFFNMQYEEGFFELSLLHCTGISLNYKGIIWYIAPYFWGSIFMIGLMHIFDKKRLTLILGMITYIGYAININYTNGGLAREVVLTFVSLGMLRVFAGLALGMIIAIIMESVSDLRLSLDINEKIKYIWYSISEIVLLLFLTKVFLVGKGSLHNVAIVIVAFSVFFTMIIKKRGIVYDMFNFPFWDYLGRYAYSIYVMQQISFYLLAKTIWRDSSLVNLYPIVTIVISISTCVLLGMIVYHLIEKPFLDCYNRWKNHHLVEKR